MAVIFKLHQFENIWLMALGAEWWEAWIWQVNWHSQRERSSRPQGTKLARWMSQLHDCLPICQTGLRLSCLKEQVGYGDKRTTVKSKVLWKPRTHPTPALHGTCAGSLVQIHPLLEVPSTTLPIATLESTSPHHWTSQCQDKGMPRMLRKSEPTHRAPSLDLPARDWNLVLCTSTMPDKTVCNSSVGICGSLLALRSSDLRATNTYLPNT